MNSSDIQNHDLSNLIPNSLFSSAQKNKIYDFNNNLDQEEINCQDCNNLKEKYRTSVDLQNKYKNLQEQNYEELKKANEMIDKLKTENFNFEKEIMKSNYSNNIIKTENNIKENKSFFTNSSRRITNLNDQNNMNRNLLDKICKLEHNNKKLKKNINRLREEIDYNENNYDNDIEILYTTIKQYIN